MAAKDERTPPKKRTETINIGKQDPLPLIYPSAEGKSASPRQTDDFLFDEGLGDPRRSNTSVVRHSPGFPVRNTTQPTMTPIPPRRKKIMTRQLQARPTRKIEQMPRPSIWQKLMKMHWLFLVGLGMIVALILWIIGSAVLAWGMQRFYDIRYGTPRTYQVDQVVGQGGDSLTHPSHFIAINENHEAIVIELRADDPAKSITYTTPVYNGDSGAPVTLEFRDVTGDGKLDMIMHIHLATQEQITVFVNNGDQFRPAIGNDHIKL